MKIENPITVTNQASTVNSSPSDPSEKASKQKNSITANQIGSGVLGSQNKQSILQKRSHRIQSANSKKQEQFSHDNSKNSIMDGAKTGSKPVCRSMPMKVVRKYNMKNPRLRPRNIVTEPTSSQATAVQTISSSTGGTTTAESIVQDTIHLSNVAESPGLKSIKIQKRESKEALPPRTIDSDQEEQIIKLLEIQQRKRLEQDPMRELDEALMDRTTASMNRRQKLTTFHSATSELRDEEFTPDIIDLSGQTITRMPLKLGSSREESGCDESRSVESADKTPGRRNQQKKTTRNAKQNNISKIDNVQAFNPSSAQPNSNTLNQTKSQQIQKSICKTTIQRGPQEPQRGLRSRDKGVYQDQNGLGSSDRVAKYPIEQTGNQQDMRESETLGNISQNKRNQKSYQKKFTRSKLNDQINPEHSATKPDAEIERSRQGTDCTDATGGKRAGEQIEAKEGSTEGINNLKLIGEQKMISRLQDSLDQSHIQLINQDTPQQFNSILNQNIIPDQNLYAQPILNHLAFKDKNSWATEASRLSLTSMNKHITLIPNLCNIKSTGRATKQQGSSEGKNKRGKMSKNSKAIQKESKNQKSGTAQNSKTLSFRAMTMKMLQLSNMIQVAQMSHLSMLRKQFPPAFGGYPQGMNYIPQGDGHNSSDEDSEEPAINKRQKLAPDSEDLLQDSPTERREPVALSGTPVQAGKQLEASGKKLAAQLIDRIGVNHTNSNSLLPGKPTRNSDTAKRANHFRGNALQIGSNHPTNRADILMTEESYQTRLAGQSTGIQK